MKNIEFNFSVSTSRKSVSYETDPALRTSIKCTGYVRGIAVLNQHVYVIVYSSKEVQVFNSSTYASNPVFQSLDCLIHTTLLEVKMFSILEVMMVKYFELNCATSRSRIGQ